MAKRGDISCNDEDNTVWHGGPITRRRKGVSMVGIYGTKIFVPWHMVKWTEERNDG